MLKDGPGLFLTGFQRFGHRVCVCVSLSLQDAGVHPYLGCCVLALSLTQPIMAAMRPAPDSRRYHSDCLEMPL